MIPPLLVYEEGESFRPRQSHWLVIRAAPDPPFPRRGFFLFPGMLSVLLRPLEPSLDSYFCGAPEVICDEKVIVIEGIVIGNGVLSPG